ncbi:eCIS core domain-containing protein [Flavobacterium ajazii]|uniref:eCIS core domain-containing protein n=1 Tax=Flavobacterium ajazii TaxID=2692318 RepID=UPI0016526348|nr:DUF4157 domain-containing protein [Flavobacterium ajazii]
MKQLYDKTNGKETQSPAANLNDKTIQNKAKTLQDNRSASILQKKTNKTGLPDNLKSGIENLSGYSMDDVKVHYNSDKPAQINAHAYAQGTNIHIASGQEKHLPHEAWHVVQQKQGRVKPTMQMKGKVNINDNKGLESEADVMGSKATSHSSSVPIQRKKNSTFNNATVQRAVYQTQSGKNWKSSELGDRLFPTKKAAEAAAISSRIPIGYGDNHQTFRDQTRPLASAVRTAAFEAHVKKVGSADGFVEPDLTIAGSSITGKRGAVGPKRPPRNFGPPKPGEKYKDGSDYDWNVGHEALAESTMGHWDEGGEKPMIVHDNDEGAVAESLKKIGGMSRVPHNVMYSRGRDAQRRNSGRKYARRDHTPVGERTKSEKDKRAAILKKETEARARRAKKAEEANKIKEPKVAKVPEEPKVSKIPEEPKVAEIAEEPNIVTEPKEKPWIKVTGKKRGKRGKKTS